MTQAFARPPVASQPRHTAGSIPSVRDVVLRALLAVAVLLPVSALFGEVWSIKSTAASTVAGERQGIEYLSAIAPVMTTLTAAESVAVNGDTVDFAPIDRAMLGLQAMDTSNTVSPGAHSRFAGLSLKVQQLHTLRVTQASDAYSAYSEVTGLVLALAEEVRLESGLIRDQEADAYFLEDGAASQLPTAVVSAGQYGDLVAIAIAQTPADRQVTIGKIAAARASLLGSADALGDDVRLAVNATASQTLSSDLLAKLDKFRLAIDSLVPPASMPNQLPSTNDRSLALADKAKVQTAATDLSNAMLTATDHLLQSRADGITHDKELAIVALLFGILVALTPVTIAAVTRKRRRAAFDGPGTGDGIPGAYRRNGLAATGSGSSRARELSGAAR